MPTLVHPGAPPGTAAEGVPSWVTRKALSGFFLSGVLFAFPGAILPVWRHHLTQDYGLVGLYFLSMVAGIPGSLAITRWLGRKRGLSFLLALGCAMASAGLFALAVLSSSGLRPEWRLAGILAVGCGSGLLNVGIFKAVSPAYRRDPAATVMMAGAFFGIGCVVVTILIAGTFWVYTVPSTLVFVALIPAFFGISYGKTRFPAISGDAVPVRQAIRDFHSPAAVLFSTLLFFQFGNEWAVAGWLPLFLVQRLGLNPESSLLMLAVYWLALFVGRIVVMWILPRVSHAGLLMGSVVAAILGCTVLVFTNNRFGAVSGILFLGGSFASIYPLVVEKIGNRFPYYHPGYYNGLFSLGMTGGMLAPCSLGIFTSMWGIRAVMIVPMLGTIMVFVLLLLIWAEARLSEGLTAAKPGVKR